MTKRTYDKVLSYPLVKCNIDQQQVSPLNDDDNIVKHVLNYVGDNQYRLIASINRNFRRIYTIISDYGGDTPPKKTLYNITNIKLTQLCYKEITKEKRSMLCNTSALEGNLHKFKYIHKILQCPFDSKTCIRAAQKGHLHIIQYAREHGCTWCDEICRTAVGYNQIHIVQYALDNGCDFPFDLCDIAASCGHLHMLQFVHDHEICEWDEVTCYNAAFYGHLHILQYLHENGCPWDKTVCDAAAERGRLHILQYAHVHDCPWDQETAILAAKYGRVTILQYLFTNGCPMDLMDILATATKNRWFGREVVMWIKSLDEFDTTFFNWNDFIDIHFSKSME